MVGRSPDSTHVPGAALAPVFPCNEVQFMTDAHPDYAALEPPQETPPAEYTTHQRRAEILQLIINAGSPHAVTQTRLADRYDVHDSTISRDMDRLRESIDEHLGDNAKLTTRALFEKTIHDLRDADDWRATKAAFDAVMDWNDWLADIGEQHREPDRSKVDVDMERTSREVSYTVVAGDDKALFGGEPSTDAAADTTADTAAVDDQEDLGFTSTPVGIDVETPEDDTE